jgi:ABC-type transport system involved in multi-copper enzyme maturation permease subunit
MAELQGGVAAPTHPRSVGARLAGLARRVARLRNLFGPIFAKEVRVAARRKRNYLLRTVYLGLLTITVSLAWMVIAEEMTVGTARGALEMAKFAPGLLVACGWFQLIAMTLIGPVLTSGSISEERVGRTLNVLLMTPITAWQIVAGKLLSRTLQMILLVALLLPVLAMVQAYGGVETVDLLATVALCMSTGLFAAALGMLISTFSNRVYVSILNSYFILLGLYLFVPFVLSWVMSMLLRSAIAQSGPSPTAVFWPMVIVTSINPFAAMGMMQVEMMNPGTLGMIGIWS